MQILDKSLLPMLRALEVELHKPAVRGDINRLSALLHDDFKEFGRSGASYAKPDILARLPAESLEAVVVADCFEVRPLGDFAVLLTYRSAHQMPDGTLARFTLRSSVWVHSAQGWQMRFHQGTPTESFDPKLNSPEP